MTQRLTIEAAVAELGAPSRRWLLEWLRANPRDKDGELYYTPVGRDKVFHPADIARIERSLREGAKCRSNSGRRVPAKRRILKSAAPTDGSLWKSAAELTGDPTLLKNCDGSSRSSTSTDSTRPQRPHLRLV